MVSSNASTVSEYLKELPPDRRKAIAEVRKMIRANLPKGYKETMTGGMIGYGIPLSRYPVTYNKQPLGYRARLTKELHDALPVRCVHGRGGVQTRVPQDRQTTRHG